MGHAIQGGGRSDRRPAVTHRIRQESGIRCRALYTLRRAEAGTRSAGGLAAAQCAERWPHRGRMRAGLRRSRRAPGSIRDDWQVERVRRARKCLGSRLDHRGFLPESGCPRRVRLGQAARRTEGTTCRVCDGCIAVGFGSIHLYVPPFGRAISADYLVHSTRTYSALQPRLRPRPHEAEQSSHRRVGVGIRPDALPASSASIGCHLLGRELEVVDVAVLGDAGRVDGLRDRDDALLEDPANRDLCRRLACRLAISTSSGMRFTRPRMTGAQACRAIPRSRHAA